MPEGDPVDGQPYLAFLGRISPLKGPDMAIEIAVKAGIRLLIAAKVDDDEQYWKGKIKPKIDRHPELVKVSEADGNEWKWKNNWGKIE